MLLINRSPFKFNFEGVLVNYNWIPYPFISSIILKANVSACACGCFSIYSYIWALYLIFSDVPIH
jgi:hypothetical protein